MRECGFDGAYSYFASAGFTEGSTPEGWPRVQAQMAGNQRLFYASAGPGYNDTLIRPWNAQATRARDSGAYYDRMWQAALDSGVDAVTITSYNEWGEGTQIEPARPHVTINGTAYADYSPVEGTFYMERTREWVARAKRARGCPMDAKVEL